MMSSVAEAINNEGASPHFWKDEVGVICLLGPVTHHLLSCPRSFDPTACDTQVTVAGEIFRLTCLALLSSLKRRASLNALDMAPLQAKLARTITQIPGELDSQLESLLLWALITSTLLQSSNMRAYMLAPIVASGSNKGFLDAQDTIECARGLIWINILEDDEEPILADEIECHWNRLWTSTEQFKG
jgi:hypothetical protein